MLEDILRFAIGIALFIGCVVVVAVLGAALDIAIDEVKKNRDKERKKTHGRNKKR